MLQFVGVVFLTLIFCHIGHTDLVEGETDAFGVTSFGFNCNGKVYEKDELYAILQEKCYRLNNLRNKSYIVDGIYSDQDDLPVENFYYKSYLKSNPFEEFPGPYNVCHMTYLGPRIRKNKDIDETGPDRLIIKVDTCSIAGMLTNFNYRRGVQRISKCVLLGFDATQKKIERQKSEKIGSSRHLA